MEASDVYVGGYGVELTGFGKVFDLVPIGFRIATDRGLSKLELRTGNSGVFLPHIVDGGRRAGGLNMTLGGKQLLAYSQ